MSQENIIDSSKPNAGRIYDYYLGGNHNFEIDRQAAQQMLQLLPFADKAARLQRWCLQDVVEELNQRHFDIIIDFASGLPTQEHIHHIVPATTTVIYSDVDPVTVEYAQRLLVHTPNAHFFRADIREPEQLLGNPEVVRILNDRRNVAFVTWGIAVYLQDEDISRLANYLYDWSGPNSCWAFMTQGADVQINNADIARIKAVYERMVAPTYIRSLAHFKEILHPWRADKNGFISMLDWHGFDSSDMTEEDKRIINENGIGHGAYLVKAS